MTKNIHTLEKEIYRGHTMTDKFVFFYGGPFSQWSRCKFTIGEMQFNCSEQYMMFQKASLFGNKSLAEKIIKSKDPSEQKQFGKQVKGLIPEQWDRISKGVVYIGNYAKFTQNEEYKEALLETGNKTIVEASPYDPLWGIGLGEYDPRALDPGQWQGKNWLGLVLMKVREQIND